MAEITNLSDVSVTIDGESYSMIVIPDKKSKLVLAERNRVLRNINLTKLIIGLSRTSDLLYLAYNGVAGFGELTGAMTKLHDRFGKLCGKCDVELGNIERQSAQIQQKLKLVFTFLLKGEEQTAINFLEQCGVVAKELADKSYALSDEFDVLGNDTVDVLSKTQIVQGQQQEKKLALDKETSDIQAKTAKAKKVAEGLAEQKSKLDNLYQEAKWKSEIAENRAFALTLAGAVLKPVGEGIGAFTAMYSGGAAIGMAKSMLMPPQMPPPPSKAGVEKDVEVKTEALNTVESENGENEKLAAEEKAKQATAENVAAEKDALAEEAKKKAEAEKDADKKAKLVVEAELAATAAKHAHEKAEKAKAAAKKAADAAKLPPKGSRLRRLPWKRPRKR
ncbi:hypothetical protein [Methylogaea oryzae]|uniref:hypothetical protein n=1 Tax=Methylogaea oryzae TaxID=1295382 RepID=UPI0006CFD93A|nr:hypothetical protein [Methylogaea oryzae]